ncbi:TadE family type IV pilus minor pilin [Parafrankia discariae]|uniref:TadE family type IV pilus minor pilin n=1 Tax=Parafrankia discariae TaxID=365528 RepID=UPI00037D47A8|nr:TadE family type IV pilus minor pilin [Parafrankia discariae]
MPAPVRLPHAGHNGKDRRNGRHARHGRDGGDGGQVTAELAMGLPSLVAVVFMVIWMIGAVSTQTRCADAARLGARAAARGEAEAATQAWARRVAPPGAAVEITRAGGAIRVRVTAAVGGGDIGRLMPKVTVAAVAVAAVEEGPVEQP